MSTPSAQVANAAAPARPNASKFKPVRLLQTPSVFLLLLWMIVPLAMTLYFSVIRYNLMMPEATGFVGLDNYAFLFNDPAFWPSILNTLLLIGSVLVISVVSGTLLAVLFDQPFFGRGIARLLVIGPFFVMPTVAALIWKNMILHPVYGLLAWAMRLVGLEPIDWLAEYPMLSVIMIVAWQWIPFAFLILLTALQSLDLEQKEAAQLDGAGPIRVFWYVVLPHLKRAITVVIMIETIFLLSIFAEIFTTTAGGPGTATTNLAYLVYSIGLQQFDIGIASAGGIIAVVLANIVSFFLVRMMAKNLKGANEK
ncbi:binding--dependent transport system inner membrane component family protein [Collimonas fungivorans]|jgi:sorbitol/mannitol transport system permease protein|uniref:Binding--dependent transport system inner membrane component family protein n=1 Tax=Collimonas fungivorans TaxID=158899 RepID=A0A127P8F3_9BURK|nr:sugar ABC transporter permease [Collimonas fungivorans]AMO94086.1 binding--dependent transport system inner membrane component family protein [Collimonas fungivorans]